ncbi:MAG: hypothetical protein AAFV59_18590 [Pseudomonadota bacterium]
MAKAAKRRMIFSSERLCLREIGLFAYVLQAAEMRQCVIFEIELCHVP